MAAIKIAPISKYPNQIHVNIKSGVWNI